MSKPRPRGFTLIELLTVIAIIAILAGITAAVLPGVMERAKVTKTETTFKELHTALTTYQTDRGSLPPGYGYCTGVDETTGDPIYNNLPYMSLIRRFREFPLYDENWSDSYDLDGNGTIDRLEFQPMGSKVSEDNYTFDPVIYDGSNLGGETGNMLSTTEPAPFAYFPVNRAQADKVRKFCINNGNIYADANAALANLFDSMTFPPPYYDDYVLISPGPGGRTFGVILPDSKWMNDPNAGDGHDDSYYINALRVFYLATRDIPAPPALPDEKDGNGEPDFDFRSRTRGDDSVFDLPDTQAPKGPGPLIYNPN